MREEVISKGTLENVRGQLTMKALALLSGTPEPDGVGGMKTVFLSFKVERVIYEYVIAFSHYVGIVRTVLSGRKVFTYDSSGNVVRS